MADSSVTFSARRERASARLADLKRQRGVALLDGKPFSSEEIVKLEHELDAMAEAENEVHRRARNEFDKQQEARREEARKNIRLYEGCRLEAIAAAETAAMDMMVAIRDVQTYSDKMDLAMRSLGVISDKTVPDGVSERLSRRLTSVMKPVLAAFHHWGSIAFPEPRDIDIGEWAPAEAALMAPDVEKALRHISSL